MKNIHDTLRKQYPTEKLQLLITTSNAKAKTYDGIAVGGERVTYEIERHIKKLRQRGFRARKISFVGYSMGGLIARYAVGLLQHNGYLDIMEPVNFTTFATPHLGAEVTILGGMNGLLDNAVSRRLSVTGSQLFLVDEHLGTRRPLLSLMAEEGSVFDEGLRRFRRRTAYGNVVGDYCVPYSTAALEPDATLTSTHEVKQASPLALKQQVILNPEEHPGLHQPHTLSSAATGLKRAAVITTLALFSPLYIPPVIAYSAYQTCRSQRRLAQHRSGRSSIDPERYCLHFSSQDAVTIEDGRPPNWDKEKQPAVQIRCLLPTPPPSPPATPNASTCSLPDSSIGPKVSDETSDRGTLLPPVEAEPERVRVKREAAGSLSSMGWTRLPVLIRQTKHAHAAIIARSPKARFAEGQVVCEHMAKGFQLGF